ncbi:MAG: immunity 70 family protein [Vicinamibacteria bacterium]|nr:immunity 70 family protein [Vicinamibacteria bacterium]
MNDEPAPPDQIWLLFPSDPPLVSLRFSADDLVALIVTIAGQLENGQCGSRFPAICEALRPLFKEGSEPVPSSDLLAELETIEEELGAVPGRVVPTYIYGDEGYPDLLSKETPSAVGTARDRFQYVLGAMRTFLAARAEAELATEREGPQVMWW